MGLRDYTVKACESIDATVFNGELLFDDEAIAQFESYMSRWQRAIAEHRAAASKAVATQNEPAAATPKEEREYKTVKHLADALASMCAASPDKVVDLLTGYLWDEVEAGRIKSVN